MVETGALRAVYLHRDGGLGGGVTARGRRGVRGPRLYLDLESLDGSFNAAEPSGSCRVCTWEQSSTTANGFAIKSQGGGDGSVLARSAPGESERRPRRGGR